ncbi:MAG: multicopper oxidase domain-containing protein [Candidatus Limnocylindrales bacterium]
MHELPALPSPTRLDLAASRRGFLRGGVFVAGGLVAAGLTACAGPAGERWRIAPGATARASDAAVPTGTAGATNGHADPMPTGTPVDHDAAAKSVVDRFLRGEWQSVEGIGNQPLVATDEDGVKVFRMTVGPIAHRIDATKDPIDALGFNGTWPGPALRVTEGDSVRAIFTNQLDESTGIHFHGQSLPNGMDGVPHVTQAPIPPGESFTYEFVARPPGSHMYHSHHNATDQVGRGLLGAFIVDPADRAQGYDQLYGTTQDIIWISNDALGGCTINGRGFPATAPIVARLGEKIVIRFMNEGVMMHPWHLHGMPMRVVARDGYPLGGAAFTCDTLGVNPGERWDVVIDCDNPGAWAFHCHILPHAEGRKGMFGMVTALIVEP